MAVGVVESLAAWPHYTAFVNVLAHYAAGDGHRLVDPKTVYRAQDLIRLSRWLAAHPEVKLAALAVHTEDVPLRLYGLPEPGVLQGADSVSSSTSPMRALAAPPPGWYAIHKSLIADDQLAARAAGRDLPGAPYLYDYLRQRPPDVRVGSTIYLYHLTAQDCRQISEKLPLLGTTD